MSKLYVYELKRSICNKAFFLFCMILASWSLVILTQKIVFGINNTAPFSSESFVYYMKVESPVLLLILFFELLQFHSKKEKEVQKLIRCTSISFEEYLSVKRGAVLTAWALLVVGVLMIRTGFLWYLFGEVLVM